MRPRLQRYVIEFPRTLTLRSFVGLAKRIAPDGEQIRQVGFTAMTNGKERFVGMTTPASELPIPPVGQSPQVDSEPVEVRGRLRYADATSDDSNQIKIVDRHRKQHNVAVPEGMMNDIVRPLWDLEVKITGARKRKGRSSVIVLEDIWPVESDQTGEA